MSMEAILFVAGSIVVFAVFAATLALVNHRTG
jgi:hypothetical protein